MKIAIVKTHKQAAAKSGKYQKKVITLSDPYIIRGERDKAYSVPVTFDFNGGKETYFAKGTDGKNQYEIWDIMNHLSKAVREGKKGIIDCHMSIKRNSANSSAMNYTEQIEIIEL